MNRSRFLTALKHEEPFEREEARMFFAKYLPLAQYDETTDSYRYRGEAFDYFMSGIVINNPDWSGSYSLVNKTYLNSWLFSPFDEKCWHDYRESVERERRFEEYDRQYNKPSLLCRLFDFIFS